MFADPPKVTWPGNSWFSTVNFWDDVGFVRFGIACLADENIDLSGVESCNRDVEVWFYGQFVQLKQTSVPAGFFRESVVCDHIRADLGRGEVIDSDRWDLCHTQGDCCLDPGVAGNYPVRSID